LGEVVPDCFEREGYLGIGLLWDRVISLENAEIAAVGDSLAMTRGGRKGIAEDAELNTNTNYRLKCLIIFSAR